MSYHWDTFTHFILMKDGLFDIVFTRQISPASESEAVVLRWTSGCIWRHFLIISLCLVVPRPQTQLSILPHAAWSTQRIHLAFRVGLRLRNSIAYIPVTFPAMRK